MLSEKDLKKIRGLIREELTIKDVEVQRTGPDGVVEKKIINLYLPEWLAAEVPNMAAALRGVQETADHAKNNSFKLGIIINKALEEFKENLIKQLKYDDAEVLKIEGSD